MLSPRPPIEPANGMGMIDCRLAERSNAHFNDGIPMAGPPCSIDRSTLGRASHLDANAHFVVWGWFGMFLRNLPNLFFAFITVSFVSILATASEHLLLPRPHPRACAALHVGVGNEHRFRRRPKSRTSWRLHGRQRTELTRKRGLQT